MAREVRVVETSNGKRYRVRYRLGGRETSETFVRRDDADMFRDILGNGKNDRVGQALAWLEARRGPQAETVTFGEWFETYVEQLTGVTPRTRGDYHSLHRRYLSELDYLPLPLISRAHVTRIVNEMDRDGRSPKTIKSAVHLLSTCLRLAIREGLMTRNPCEGVNLPKQSIDAVEPRFMTHEEAGRLVAAMPDYYQPLVTFLLGTGLRWAEATAIQTRHVDLANGTVRVERAWKRIPGKGYEIGPPKTGKSRRTVNAAVPALLATKTLLRKPNDLVFVTRSGGRITHANFYNNVWRPSCERAKIDPWPRIHDCRHSFASWLISDGISLEAVQDQLGHESILTTRKVYGHLLPALGVAAGRSASAAMEAVLVHRSQVRALGAGGADEVADS